MAFTHRVFTPALRHFSRIGGAKTAYRGIHGITIPRPGVDDVGVVEHATTSKLQTLQAENLALKAELLALRWDLCTASVKNGKSECLDVKEAAEKGRGLGGWMWKGKMEEKDKMQEVKWAGYYYP